MALPSSAFCGMQACGRQLWRRWADMVLTWVKREMWLCSSVRKFVQQFTPEPGFSYLTLQNRDGGRNWRSCGSRTQDSSAWRASRVQVLLFSFETSSHDFLKPRTEVIIFEALSLLDFLYEEVFGFRMWDPDYGLGCVQKQLRLKGFMSKLSITEHD